MAEFFQLLTDIVQSEGVHRKRDTPSRNLDHFVELIGALDPHGGKLPVGTVVARLNDLTDRLAGAEADLDHRARLVIAAVFDKLGPLVSKQIRRHAADKNQVEFERECANALHRIVAEEMSTHLTELLRSAGGEVARAADRLAVSGFVKFESISVRIPKSNRKTTGAFGGAVGGGGGGYAGALAGAAAGSCVPIVGNAIGGVLGFAIGSFFGSAVGSVAGELLGSDWEETMQSGDNRAAVEATAVKALQDAGQAAVKRFFEDMKRDAMEPVKRHAERMELVLTAFSSVLMRKVHSNGRPISSHV